MRRFLGGQLIHASPCSLLLENESSRLTSPAFTDASFLSSALLMNRANAGDRGRKAINCETNKLTQVDRVGGGCIATNTISLSVGAGPGL